MLEKIFFLVFLLRLLKVGAVQTSVEWQQVQSYDAFVNPQDPAGFENEVKHFICRFKHDVHIISGKLVVNNGEVTCVIPFHLGQIASTSFEMLVGPPGVLSWVPYNEVVDENNVYAGIVDNTSVYLCRTKFGQDQLLIGVLNPIRKVCIVAQGNGEYTATTNIEMLSRNMFGSGMNITIPQP